MSMQLPTAVTLLLLLFGVSGCKFGGNDTDQPVIDSAGTVEDLNVSQLSKIEFSQQGPPNASDGTTYMRLIIDFKTVEPSLTVVGGNKNCTDQQDTYEFKDTEFLYELYLVLKESRIRQHDSQIMNPTVFQKAKGAGGVSMTVLYKSDSTDWFYLPFSGNYEDGMDKTLNTSTQLYLMVTERMETYQKIQLVDTKCL